MITEALTERQAKHWPIWQFQIFHVAFGTFTYSLNYMFEIITLDVLKAFYV